MPPSSRIYSRGLICWRVVSRSGSSFFRAKCETMFSRFNSSGSGTLKRAERTSVRPSNLNGDHQNLPPRAANVVRMVATCVLGCVAGAFRRETHLITGVERARNAMFGSPFVGNPFVPAAGNCPFPFISGQLGRRVKAGWPSLLASVCQNYDDGVKGPEGMG